MPLSCSQLIALAVQKANAPGFVSQAGQELNLLLEHLAQTYDFASSQGWWAGTFGQGIGGDVNSASVVAGSGPYQVPVDFLRMDLNDFFWVNQGINYFPTPLDISEFDQLVQQPGFTSYSTAYAIDVSTTPYGLYVWPAPSGAYPVYGRYHRRPLDVATPQTSSTVPWFPSQAALLQGLSSIMMGYSGDSRQQQWWGDDMGNPPSSFTGLLKAYKAREGNMETRAARVTLDRRHFGPRWNSLPPTKQIPW